MKIKIQRKNGAPRIEIEVNPDDTIPDLKKKIEAVFGAKDFPAATQFLVYRGRHLICSDYITLRELNIVEDGTIGVVAFPKRRIMLPEEVWARAACSSSPAPVAPVISSAVSKLDDRKADLNVVARSSLSMCKDPKLGIKVYTRRKNLNVKLVNMTINSAHTAWSKLDDRKADVNVVARSNLSMRKDPKLGFKVYTRRKNLNGKLVNMKSSVKLRDGFR